MKEPHLLIMRSFQGIIGILFFFIAMSSFAENSACPDFKKKEGVWYIPESAFTQQEANKALNDLKQSTNEGIKGVDFVNIKNDLLMVQGFLYKQSLAAYEKEFGGKDEMLLKEFCRFLEQEAYIRH